MNELIQLAAPPTQTGAPDPANLTTDPTQQMYHELRLSYDWFNRALFGDKLPPAMVTLQRRSGSFGYFAARRFGVRDGADTTDEIALNPATFKHRTPEEILGTLVHEMVHLWQQHFGNPSGGTYHNREWAEMMLAVGLIPTNTGQPGGKQTGQAVSHMIDPNGPFAAAAQALLQDISLPFVDLWDADKAKAKLASKTKYTCPNCGLNAWAKPNALIACLECTLPMLAVGVSIKDAVTAPPLAA